MTPELFKDILNSGTTFSVLFLIAVLLYLNYERLRRIKESSKR